MGTYVADKEAIESLVDADLLDCVVSGTQYLNDLTG